MKSTTFKTLLFISFIAFHFLGQAQVNWSNSGDFYYEIEESQLVSYTLPNHDVKTILSTKQLTPEGHSEPIQIAHFAFSEDGQKVLLFTNTQKVWRLRTRGDYWVFDFQSSALAN